MNKLTPNLSIEECLNNYIASINGKHVIFNDAEYIAMDVRIKNGKWIVDLYNPIDCDQVQVTQETCFVIVKDEGDTNV